MAKGRATEWLPNHLFPWNLLGRQIIGTRSKRRLPVPQSPWKHNWAFCHQLPPVTSSAPGDDGVWGVILDTAVCRKLWICLQTVRMQTGKGNTEGKKDSREDHCLVLSQPFSLASIWPKTWGPQWDTTTTFWWQILPGFWLVLEHMHLAREREWQRERGTSWLAEKHPWHELYSHIDTATSCTPRWRRIWKKAVVSGGKNNKVNPLLCWLSALIILNTTLSMLFVSYCKMSDLIGPFWFSTIEDTHAWDWWDDSDKGQSCTLLHLLKLECIFKM